MKKLLTLSGSLIIIWLISVSCTKDVLQTAPHRPFKPHALALDTSYSNTVRTFASNGDTIYTTTTTTVTTSVVVKKYVAPVVVNVASIMPGGLVSNKVSYSYKNNFTISGLSFNGGGQAVDLLTLNNCSNVHITLCRFSNTSGRAIVLNNCSNVTVDYNFYTFVGFGVDAIGCTGGIKVNFNQGLNLWRPQSNGQYLGNYAHWVQFFNCSGPNQTINDNIFVNVDYVAVNPHDAISCDAASGTPSSPIQIMRNKIKGGQLYPPVAGQTGVGITAPDVSGSYYDIEYNTVINSGVNGMLAITSSTSTSSNVTLSNNIIINDDKNATVSYDGLTITGAKSNYVVANNHVRWMQPNGSYMGLWLGSSGKTTMTGVTFSNNNWNDITLLSSLLSTSLLTYK
jgi:hypothetical protein